jgi:acyl carrier protein
MNQFDPEGMRAFLRNYLVEKLASQGRDAPKELADDCDLLLSGMIDSLGLLELVTAFQEHCGCEIDFDALDPERMTVVGPLCDFVSSQVARG